MKLHQFLFVVSVATTISAPLAANPLDNLSLLDGFNIDYYAQGLKGARQLTLDDQGVVYVGSRNESKVYALLPNADKTKAGRVEVLIDGLNYPNGVAFHHGKLYVAELDKISVFEVSRNQHKLTANKGGEIGEFPNKVWHGFKYIKFSPEGDLYTAVGMPCNTCFYRNSQPIFGTIVKVDAKGKTQIVAKGVRNSVGFDWQPATKALWFTDNGQDMLGDDTPPDELNHVSYVGEDFGFPYVYSDNVVAPDYKGKAIPKKMTAPAYKFQAHVAPLGMTFYRGKQFPESFHNQIIIAQHGSWNRSKPVGYRLMLARVNGREIKQVTPFIDGWLGDKNKVTGRPVDVLNMPDGSLLVSDDFANAVYRVSYQK